MMNLQQFEAGMFATFADKYLSKVKFTAVQAFVEATILSKCYTLEDYLTVSRVGTTVALDRRLRVSIYTLWQNACNHAAVAYRDDQKKWAAIAKKKQNHEKAVYFENLIMDKQEAIETELGLF